MTPLAWPLVVLVALLLLWVEGRRYLDIRRDELAERRDDKKVSVQFAALQDAVTKYRQEVQGLKGYQAMASARKG